MIQVYINLNTDRYDSKAESNKSQTQIQPYNYPKQYASGPKLMEGEILFGI